MMTFSRKSILQNAIGTLVFVAIFGVITYFGFYLRLPQSDYDKEIKGTVCEKWIDVSETEQGSNLKPKALIETETGEKIVIKFDQKTHDQIKIGTLVKRETNGDVKILR